MFNFSDEQIIAQFPFPKIRPQQLEAIKAIFAAYNEGFEHVILEAPTGAGKSGIAVTVARLLNSVDPAFKSVIATATKFLQDQYSKDFPFLKDIRSASDQRYTCNEVFTTRNTENCLINRKATDNKCQFGCPYKIAGKAFAMGPISLTNTQFFVRYPRRKALAVLDECHEMPNVIASVVEIPFFKPEAGKLSLIFRDKTEMLIELFDKIVQATAKYTHGEVFEFPDFNDLAKDMMDEINFEVFDERAEGLVGTKEFNAVTRHYNAFKNAIGRMELSSRKEMIKIIERDDRGNEMPIIKPVFADAFAPLLVYTKADRFLHMSATICGFKAYAEEMGIPKGTWKAVSVEHTIEIERRRFFFSPVAWMSAKTEEGDYHKIASKVEELFAKYNANTILHTASYKRAERVTDLMFLVHKHVPRSAVEALKLLGEGVEKEEPTLVASPSLVAGIDGKDDLCRLNIICKVPYPSFGDPRIKYISKTKPEIINQHLVRSIVQAAGRATRHENDWSDSYILDGVFERVFGENSHLFPKWFKDSIIWKTKA